MDLSKMRGWRELVAGETGAPEVVFVEHHPRELSTARQWREFLTAAFAEGVIGVGTFLITAQEADPLGIPDLSVGKAPGATRREMEEAILDSAEACQLRARILRTFTSSWDFPVLPEEEPSCFSHVCLIEEPVNP
ncbi:unnamed protein product [Phytomonas sp. EM1]|nr:unnamed protein product [Phytomonas sp. EM1]|eukprot:CCW61604.1 unnamed protein product [Phytomonas sp. isolate EM1]